MYAKFQQDEPSYFYNLDNKLYKFPKLMNLLNNKAWLRFLNARLFESLCTSSPLARQPERFNSL